MHSSFLFNVWKLKKKYCLWYSNVSTKHSGNRGFRNRLWTILIIFFISNPSVFQKVLHLKRLSYLLLEGNKHFNFLLTNYFFLNYLNFWTSSISMTSISTVKKSSLPKWTLRWLSLEYFVFQNLTVYCNSTIFFKDFFQESSKCLSKIIKKSIITVSTKKNKISMNS